MGHQMKEHRRGWQSETEEDLLSRLCDEIERLRAENKRLRAELEKANEPVWPVIQAVRPQDT